MNPGRRSFIGAMLSLMATPFLMGGCPRRKRRLIARGHLDIVSTQHHRDACRCVTVTTDEATHRLFAEGIGKKVFGYNCELTSRTHIQCFFFNVPGDSGLVHCTFFTGRNSPLHTTEEEIAKSVNQCIKAGCSVHYRRTGPKETA